MVRVSPPIRATPPDRISCVRRGAVVVRPSGPDDTMAACDHGIGGHLDLRRGRHGFDAGEQFGGVGSIPSSARASRPQGSASYAGQAEGSFMGVLERERLDDARHLRDQRDRVQRP